MTTLLAILAGLAVLVAGAELLVRGAVRLAERAGVSPLLTGLVIVGFGTSTPELMASVQGSLAGSPGIAVGNIVGSNLFNSLVILGLAALIRPLSVAGGALWRDGVVMAAVAFGFAALGLVWTLDRAAGAVLAALMAGYLWLAWRQERAAGPAEHGAAFDKAEAFEAADPALRPRPAGPDGLRAWAVPAGTALLGLLLLLGGARLLVEGAIGLAQALGVSEAVIGLTIVAAGTSLPELAASALAALRRQGDVAVGNVLGSNIYNVLGIGGATALLAPTAVPPEVARFDAPLMAAACLLLLLFLASARRLSRAEGAVLVAAYAGYVWAVWPA
ncbi:MAG: calcium/sodium antiporter [Acetobacteraceae bacterium]|nr:calcium/sodium antiporter [Acetobacteraceae bacterium]